MAHFVVIGTVSVTEYLGDTKLVPFERVTAAPSGEIAVARVKRHYDRINDAYSSKHVVTDCSATEI
jgi:hypothetical protein